LPRRHFNHGSVIIKFQSLIIHIFELVFRVAQVLNHRVRLLIVKFHSVHSDADVLRILKERVPLVEGFPGLVQKYYTREAATGAYVGMHFFDSQDALERYRRSAAALSLPSAFQVLTAPRTETLSVLFSLYPDDGFERSAERARSSMTQSDLRGEP
jgi:hypothetical protein